ncbi:MAG: hypothetical protein M3535_00465 [Actinomycetota bacterium]|nr:hypothetical protein [Actinomycetota bacterium]
MVRLDPSGAFLLGDEEAVPASVVDDLTAAGIPEETIERLDGPDDATLAAAVARAVDDTPRVSADELEDLTEEGASPPEIEKAVILNPDDEGAPSGAPWPPPAAFQRCSLSPTGFPRPRRRRSPRFRSSAPWWWAMSAPSATR